MNLIDNVSSEDKFSYKMPTFIQHIITLYISNMKTILSIILFLPIYTGVFSQEININSTNYLKYLDLEKQTLRDSISSKYSFTSQQTFNTEQDTKALICQEFKIRNAWISNSTFVYNEYRNDTSHLSIGFMTFTIKTQKQANKLLETEQKKRYKNFKLKVLTKYFLVRNGQKFTVIFTETPLHPLIEQLFYP